MLVVTGTFIAKENNQDRRGSQKKEEMKLHKDYEKYINYSKAGALQLIADLAVCWGWNRRNNLPMRHLAEIPS